MSCFWDALIRELNAQEATRADVSGVTRPYEFVQRLKAQQPFVMTRWQGQLLTEQQRAENAAAIAQYDLATTGDGYDCGSSDPFLLLVAHVAGVHIRHRTPHGTFEYTSMHPDARWITLVSNHGHMH